MPSDPYAPTAWGQGNEFDFTAPSGQLCRLKKVDPVDLVADGLLGKLDFLTSIVVGEHLAEAQMTPMQRAKANKAKATGKAQTEEQIKEEALNSLMSDPRKLKDFSKILNEVVIGVVVKPEIHPVPVVKNNEPAPEREAGLVYVDTVDFNDRVAIFNAVMSGVKNLEPFREEPQESVAVVASKPGVRKPAKRKPRTS